MSGPIQTIPQGLLGLLQLKELGKNPGVLVDSVAPNLDLFQLYAQRNMVSEGSLFGSSIASAALVNGNHGFQTLTSSVTTCQVPNNEMWYVYEWSLDVQAQNAADFIAAAPAVLALNQTRAILVAPIYADVISARVRGWISSPLTNAFFAGPSTVFGFYVTDILAGTTITVTATMRAARLPI